MNTNNSVKVFFATLIALVLACMAYGQTPVEPAQVTPPVSLPVNSRAEYKAYALSRVVKAQISYNMKHAVESNNDGLEINGSDVTDIMKKIGDRVFIFDTTNVEQEEITTYIWLMDENYNSAFEGTSKDKVTLVNGRATFSPQVEIKLLQYVPLETPGAQSLEIRVVNEWGYREVCFNGDVYSNTVWIPADYIGPQYEYVVAMNDGNVYVYQNGRRAVSTEVVRAGNFKISQFQEIKIGLNNSEFVQELQQSDEPTSPVFKIETTANNAPFCLDSFMRHKDGLFERPTQAYWFNVNTPNNVIVVPIGPDGKVHTILPTVGKYFLAVKYKTLESPTYTSSYGGKG